MILQITGGFFGAAAPAAVEAPFVSTYDRNKLTVAVTAARRALTYFRDSVTLESSTVWNDETGTWDARTGTWDGAGGSTVVPNTRRTLTVRSS